MEININNLKIYELLGCVKHQKLVYLDLETRLKRVNTIFNIDTYIKLYDEFNLLKDALCGFTFELKYINGKSYTLNNNRGSIVPPEYKKVYPDMGLKRNEHKGNMIIHFHVEFPEKLTDEQIDKLIQIL